jgi:hypothetical protein
MIKHQPAIGVIARLGLRLLVLAAGLATIIATGGGGGADPTSTACAVTVVEGFFGNLEATYPGGTGGDAGGGGDGSGGGDGGGDGGAGGGLGKTVGALISVTRLSDGAVYGPARTDSVKGVVRVHVCSDTGPILLTMQGTATATYYDEGKGAMLPFGPDQTLHALVDRVDENLGISPLTEAAYRYAINNFVGDPAVIRSGAAPLLRTARVVGLTTSQIRQANDIVMQEVNRQLPTATHLSSIKALPTPIDNSSSNTTLPVSAYGLVAVAVGGIVVNANNYLPSAPQPALIATEQFARDFSDGKLDGFALDGSPSAAGSSLAYDAIRFPIALDSANYLVSANFGANSTFQLGSGITDFTIGSMVPAGDPSNPCTEIRDDIALQKDGRVNVFRLTPAPGDNCVTAASVGTRLTGFATDVRFVRSVTRQAFLIGRNGAVSSWGDEHCGLLGAGILTSRRTTPGPVAVLADITSLSTGNLFAIARDKTGSVYSWGSDYVGALGLGSNPSYDIAACEIFSGAIGTPSGVGANFTPRKIPTLSNVVSVVADQLTAYALDSDGNVFQWGLVLDPNGSFMSLPTPTRVDGLTRVTSIAASFDMLFALRTDGTVWGFGANTAGSFGDGSNTRKVMPTPVPGLTEIVAIAGDTRGGAAAMKRDGTVLIWDGGPFRTPTSPQMTICTVPSSLPYDTSACISSVRGPIPPMRHISGNGFVITMFGVDGNLYVRYPAFDVLYKPLPENLK